MKKLFPFVFILLSALPSYAASSNDQDALKNVVQAPFDLAAGTFDALTGTVFDLGFIHVEGGRLESGIDVQSQWSYPISSDIVSEEEIGGSVPVSLPEKLSRQEGVTYTDDMGQGLGARIDLRGFGGEAKQSLVLMDGLRAVEPFDNSVTWSLYPAEYFESIHLLPGGASPVYGEGALSGVIAMKTRDPQKEWHTRGEASYGSYRTNRYYAEASGTTPAGIGLLIGGRFIETDGYRQNGSHEGVSTLVKTNYAWTDLLKVENEFYFADNETGIPGPLLPLEAAADRRQKDPDGQFGDKFTDRLVQNGLWFDYFAEPVGVQITNLAGYRLRNQNSIQSFGGAFPGTSINAIGTETFSDVVQASRSWGEAGKMDTLFAGVEWAIDDIHNPFRFEDKTFGPFTSDRSIDRDMLGFFVKNKLELWEKWILEAGARFDKIGWGIYDQLQPHLEKHKKADALSPQIASSFAVTENVTFFGGYSEAFKAPDSNTLIFETPNLFSPTPDIDPSFAHHTEAGARVKVSDAVDLRGTYFHIETKKEILFNDITNRNENFDTLRDGAEIAAEWRATTGLKVFANYTYTEARFDNGIFDRKAVPLVPESQWSAGVEVGPVADWTVRLEAAGVDQRFALNDLNNLFKAEDYWISDLEIRRAVPHGDIYIKMNNLFDEQYSQFATSDGVSVLNLNPSPGFNLEAGVRLEI